MTAKQSLQQIKGLICRNFRLIADGSLILYIGDLAADKWMSEWRLHIDAAWRLEGADGPLMGRFDALACDDSQAARQRCLASLRSLVERRIISTECAGPLADLTLCFDDNLILRTFTYAIESDAWELRHRSGKRFGFSACAYREWREDPDKHRPDPGTESNGGSAA